MTSRRLDNSAVLLAMLILTGPAFGEKITPDLITTQMIAEARTKAIRALYEAPDLQPAYDLGPADAYWHTSSANVPQAVRNMMGNHALICWALLTSGESYQYPKFSKRIHWVLSGDQPFVYDRGMRLAMLAKLPSDRWGPWIRRDALWMTAAITTQGNFEEEWYGKQLTGFGDNANGQYGALGLWVYEQAGYSLKKAVWEAIDKYWREAMISQNETAGGWAIFSAKAKQAEGVMSAHRISGPMTAGGVATLARTERALYGPKMIKPGEQHVSPELQKGLHWLDRNFTLDDKDEATDRYYYYWTIQRVALATGYRSFNNVDWFRDITARMLNEQQEQGTWEADKGKLLSTGFAVLYLAQAYDPVSIGKVRFAGTAKGKEIPYAWNNRPHDIWNFTEYISDQYEYTTGWQIVQLSLPVYTLMETPILYMATDARFSLSDKEIENLREYLYAGGLLITNPDAATGEVGQSIKELQEKLFAGQDLKKVEPGHDLYSVHQKVGPTIAMQMVHNGIRPLWIHFVRDIGAPLQAGDVSRADSFRILSNIYLYATGMNPRRQRLDVQYVIQTNKAPTKKFTVARIKHDGKFDPEPGALSQLARLVANKRDINLTVNVIDASELKPDVKLAMLTTSGDGKLTEAQASAIRKWLEGGGMIWIDAAGGSTAAATAAEAMAKAIAGPAVLAPLGMDHPIIAGITPDKPGNLSNRWVTYRPYALKSMGPVNVSRLQCAEIGGKVNLIYSSHDITCGLAGLEHWGIYGYSTDSARSLILNAILLQM